MIAVTLAGLMLVAPAAAEPPKLTRQYGHHSMHGFKESTYKGRFYPKDAGTRAAQDRWRKCVMWRESRNTYGARNHPSVSSAAGAYQFLDFSWRKPLGWMMNKENRAQYGNKTAKRIRYKLWSSPIETWSREIQDQAFYTVLNFNGPWSGWRHWTGHSCNHLVGG